MPIFITLFFLLFNFATTCLIASPGEQTFYAVCSLCYHLDELIDAAEAQRELESDHALDGEVSDDDAPIPFSEDALAQLWHNACSCPSTYEQVMGAYAAYEQALLCPDAPQAFIELCAQTRLGLEKVWQRLRQEPEETESYRLVETLAPYTKAATKKPYKNFDDNPFLSNSMRQRIDRYLIPQKHPAKKVLDRLFEKGNPIQNSHTYRQAGFQKIAQHSSMCTVAKHSLLGRYLVKFYSFDSISHKLNRASWEAFCTRCESAEEVRTLITKHKMRYFSVSDKWIYVLPPHVLANALPHEFPHPVLLVVENMELVGQHKSLEAWRTKTTRRLLDELYCMMSHGYGSTKLPQNVPYTKNGKFAFIDTEYPKRLFDYAKVKRFIPPEMQAYWDELVRKGKCPL